MSFPLLLMGLPLVTGVLVYNLRRWLWLQVIVAVGTVLVLIALVQLETLDQLVVVFGRDITLHSSSAVLGRSFTFGEADRPILVFVFVAVLLYFLAVGVVRGPSLFLPVGLGMLPLMEATIFVQPFLYAALFLALIAAVAAFILSNRDYAGTDGAMRYLAFVSMGVPFILLAGWQLEVHQINPDDMLPLKRATWMLGVGFLVILAVAPFHSWVALVSRKAPPLSAAFVIGVVQAVVLIFLIDTLTQFDWLRANTQFFLALRLGGVAMAVVGAAFTFAQRSLGGLMGYTALIDWGATLVVLGLRTPDSIAVASMMIVVRVLGLVVWGVGAGVLMDVFEDDYDKLRSCARNYPFATTAVVVGGLSLSALPLLAGFPGRWELFRMLSADHIGFSIVLILAGVSAWWGYVRVLPILFEWSEPQTESSYFVAGWEKWGTIGFVTLGVVTLLCVGLAPKVLTPFVQPMLDNLAKLLV